MIAFHRSYNVTAILGNLTPKYTGIVNVPGAGNLHVVVFLLVIVQYKSPAPGRVAPQCF